MNNFCKFESHDISYFFFSIVNKNVTKNDIFNLSINIYLTDCNNYYEAKLSNEMLLNLSNNPKFTKEEFYNLTEETFNGKNENGIEIKHSKQKNIDVINLVWKKVFSDMQIKIVAGSVQLTDITSQLFYSNLFLTTSSNNYNFDNLMSEHNSLKEQYLNIKQRADELLNIKEKIEKDLYSKFVLVLNSKKEEIQNLKTALDQYKLNASESTENLEKKVENINLRKKKNKRTVKAKLSEEELIGDSTLNLLEGNDSPNFEKEILPTRRSKRNEAVKEENPNSLESLSSNISLVFDNDDNDDNDYYNDNITSNNYDDSIDNDNNNSFISKKKKVPTATLR